MAIDFMAVQKPLCEPWWWNIYLQKCAIFGVNVGKYSSTMEHMGKGYQNEQCEINPSVIP